MIEGFKPPCVVFRTRVRDDSIEGDNPFRWEDVTSDSLFKVNEQYCLVCRVHSHLLAQHINYRALKKIMIASAMQILMKYIVSALTMRL